MGISLKQPGFGGGIISPQALGRTDQTKYAVGLRQCSNAWITRFGTLENRPGTIFCGEVKSSSARVRLAPFIFSSAVSYLLEWGNDYLRVYQDGARISVAGAAAYAGGTTYAQGDLVTYLGVVYRSLASGNVGNQPNTHPASWNVQTADLLEVVTDLPQAALPDFQYIQQNDILTVATQHLAPHQLDRFSSVKWQWVPFAQSTGIAAPTGVVAIAGVPPSGLLAPPTAIGCVGGSNPSGTDPTDEYYVAAYDASTISVADGPGTSGINFASVPFPITITWVASAGAVGYAIYCNRPSIPANGLIAVVDAATLTYTDDASITPAGPVAEEYLTPPGFTSYTYVVTAISSTTGAQSLASSSATCVGNTPSGAHPNRISWAAVAGASSYRVYRMVGGVPGFIGEQPASPFLDTNFLPDTSIQPPQPLDLFGSSDKWPAVCGYYQQRLMFANTLEQPQTVWASRVGNYNDFTTSTPVQDSDSLQFTIAGRQVQEVRALIDLGKLVIHTSNAEYVGQGNQAGALTPTATSVIATGSTGSALIAPVVLGNTDLFVQDGSTRVNDLRYEVQSFSYAGKDLTKLATDLFRGRTIVDMAWQKLPHSIVWCVLDNGQMVGLTYVREDELWAWHLHSSTNGAIENVAVVPEGTEHTVYLVVRRVIGGQTKRYIERLAPRDCTDTVMFTDSVFADSALTYDGRNTGVATITATTGGGWTPTDTLTLTASAPTFLVGDVGNVIVFQHIDALTGLVDDSVSFNILVRTSATVAVVTAQRDVPAWARSTALTTWGKAVRHFTGIGHLEGQSLAILADGNVAANPLNPDYPLVTVASGAFTLPTPAMVVTAGLPVQMDVETLPLESIDKTIANRRVTVAECNPIFHESRGGLFGQDFDHLHAWKQPKGSPAGFPVAGFTGPFRIPIAGTPQTTGQVCMRNTDPVPFGISALVISGEVGS